MINSFKKIALKHGYLIIAAAWLYTISFIFLNYWSYSSSPQKVKSKLEYRITRLEKQFDQVLLDTTLLSSLINRLPGLVNPLNEELGLFIYQQGKGVEMPVLTYWNTNRIYITIDDVFRPSGSYFIDNKNGQFEMISKKLSLKSGDFTVIAMLPIRWAYFIQNKYLQNEFAGFDGINDQYEISSDLNSLAVINSEGMKLFNIKLKEGKSFIAYDSITVLLRVLAIIFLLLFLHSLAQELVIVFRFMTGFLFLLITVAFIRGVSYLYSFPFDFSKLPLFDPAVYASNFLHPSLGDLFVNSILLFWLVNFYKIYNNRKRSFYFKIPLKLYAYANLLVLAILCFLLSGIVISLVRDSKIPFDVTNVYGLNVFSIISFVILCFLTLLFFHFSQILLQPAIQCKISVYFQCLAISLFGLALLLFFSSNDTTRIYLWVLVWLLVYIIILNRRKKDLTIPLVQSPFFIFWVMILTLSIAALVIQQNGKVEFEQRKRIAEKLIVQTDPSGENLLNIAATNFDDHFLVNNFERISQNEYSNKFIKDSLINQNFSGYLNKYDTQIYTYDSLFRPLFNDDSLGYAAIQTIVLNKAKSTVIANLFRYENTEGFSYVYRKIIQQNHTILGYVFVIIKSKRYKSEALYPELFTQAQEIGSDLTANYAYAVYARGRMINHFNNYGFPSVIDTNPNKDFQFTQTKNGTYSELWYNGGNNKQVVVVKKDSSLIEAITLFAYLFCSFLSIIFLFHIINYLIRARFNWQGIKKMFRLNIRSQIQATIIFLSIFSFFVIGIVTISFFILRFNQNNEERLSKSIQVMANEINVKITSLKAFDDLPDNYGIKAGLEKEIAEISDLHNVDINYYNLQGNLIISTQPYIYNKHLVSTVMDPNAYKALQIGHNIRYLQSERIGSFEYLSIYVPLVNDAGNNYAYLNIPYLNSVNELNQEISGFLAALINLNAFIFLIAGAIAFFLTNRITASFGLIGRKMQEMSLGRINETIEWNRNDEIGLLVQEYNKMVKKLEFSAQALAQSEREGAWREMARQVAHEIKNPLTPMKLSIQYLQNAIQKDAPNVKALSQSMAVTLIEQIDQLSKIAGDFSLFANIGNAKMEIFDIKEVLSSIVRLYSANPRIQIDYLIEQQPSFIFADRVQMNRLFTNLLQNAIEANPDIETKVNIEIAQKVKEDHLILSIKDTSGGIPENMKKNIFTPNFTTKSSGTGLGLAICKGIVENANGYIWFETQEGVGTTFIIQLPLAG